MACRSWRCRVALGAVVGALFSSHVSAALYSAPDYSINANVSPYTASGPVTVTFSVSNLSDATAPVTTVEFWIAPAADPDRRLRLGHASVSALLRWSSKAQGVSFPLPAGTPTGYTAMRLTADVNPQRGNGEQKFSNNVTTSNFATQVASALPPSSSPAPAPLAVMSAPQGFGAATPGGAGKPVYLVTSLAASGPGTLKDAVSQGNRYVKFAVAGVIGLTDAIRVKGAFITIDGFSAPAPGITLRGGGLYLMNKSSTYGFNYGTHDVIVRGIRVRDSVNDAFRIAYGAYNVVIDHVSVKGAGDGSIDITEDAHDVTVSWSIFADPVNQVNSLLAYRSRRLTMHHNLFIASWERNPSASYDYSGAPSAELTLDFRNNVVWGWGDGRGAVVRYGSRANIVNNYFHSPSGNNDNSLIVCRSTGVPPGHAGYCRHGSPTFFGRAFVSGNVNPGLRSRNINSVTTETSAFPAPAMTTESACTAARRVKAQAGVAPRDAVDKSFLFAIAPHSDLCP